MDKRELITSIQKEAVSTCVAGRIMSVRKMKNYSFCDIMDVSGRLQVIVAAERDILTPSVGDIVLASGMTIKTNKGQLSVDCSELTIISPGSIDVVNAIKSVSTAGLEINGQRSLNLMVNTNLRKMVEARSILIGIIRDHCKTGDFLEIDTPIMSYSRFAGTAEVFETKSRSLDRSLYLRGTLEDYLKQLIVSGFEKVFQIGDCFRNESPALIEFTMLEATWAYAKSEQMLGFIQDLFTSLSEQLPDNLIDSGIKQELAKKIEIVSFWGVLSDYFGVDIRTVDLYQIRALAKKENYSYSSSEYDEYEVAKFGYDVIKRKLAHEFKSLTFVGRFPACISPLAKKIQDESGEADRGYGFFKGQRLLEVVGEASNFEEQLNKFQAQDERGHNHSYSFKHDDLLTSLKYGCPPMAGLGFNINRVLAVLLDVKRTSDVMAFPLTSAALPL